MDALLDIQPLGSAIQLGSPNRLQGSRTRVIGPSVLATGLDTPDPSQSDNANVASDHALGFGILMPDTPDTVSLLLPNSPHTPPPSSMRNAAALLFAPSARLTRPLPRSRLNPSARVPSASVSAPLTGIPVSFTIETRSRKRSREESEASGQPQVTSASALLAASGSDSRKKRRVLRGSDAVSSPLRSEYRTRSVARREAELRTTQGRNTNKRSRQ